MAQWNFVVSWNDVWPILDLITKRPDTELVHDLWYKKEAAICYSSLNPEVRADIKKRASLYIKGRDFTRLPIRMRDNVGKDGERLHMISANEDGPLLRLLMFGEYRENGKPIIPPSSLTCEDEYLNTTTGVWEKPRHELKAAFKEIQRLMKTQMIRHKGPSGFVWIGKYAFELLKAGHAKTSYWGLKF